MKGTNILPISDDPPLNVNIPKPSFANSRTGSAFGFQCQGPVDQAAALQPLTKATSEINHLNNTQNGED